MKQDKTYNKVVGKLRGIKPTLNKPENLTDLIMDQLTKHQGEKKKGINITSNSGGWSIFIGFRAVAAVAAVFLFGFFAFQQWEIMSEVSRLEAEVNSQKNTSVSMKAEENLGASYFKTRLEQQVKSKKLDFLNTKGGKESITLNRNSLSQLIRLFEQMEEENRSLKAEIIKQFIDTTITNRYEKLKYKSL